MAMNTDATMPRNNERSGPSTSYSHHANRPKIAAAAANGQATKPRSRPTIMKMTTTPIAIAAGKTRQQKARARLVPRLPYPWRGQSRQHRARPERHPKQQKVVSRRRAMRFLSADHLGQHVLANRLREETTAGLGNDRGEPGQHQHDQPGQAGERTQRPDPTA